MLSELTVVARPYAKAAFRRAVDGSALAQWQDFLSTAAAVAAESTMKDLLRDPAVSSEQVLSVFTAVCGNEMTEEQKAFLSLLADYERLGVLPTILMLFNDYRAAHEKRVDVEVISAVPLDDAQQSGIKERMAKRLGLDVDVHYRIDASLLGGMIVRAGDLVINHSVRNKLERLAFTLSQ